MTLCNLSCSFLDEASFLIPDPSAMVLGSLKASDLGSITAEPIKHQDPII